MVMLEQIENLYNSEMRIHTPLGVDKFWLRINEDNSGVLDSGLDEYPFTSDDCYLVNGCLTINVDINAPVREHILIEFGSNRRHGIMKVGHYPALKFEVYGEEK
jgi:hypothetical protein